MNNNFDFNPSQMKQFQNVSKFRNSILDVKNKPMVFPSKTIDTGSSEPCPLSANLHHLAYSSGSAIGVFNYDKEPPVVETIHYGATIPRIEWILQLLVAGAEDGTVKIFHNSGGNDFFDHVHSFNDNDDKLFSNCKTIDLCSLGKRIESIAPSPGCKELIAIASGSAVSL